MAHPTPPPISAWGHVWRYGLMVMISALAWSELVQWQWSNAKIWFWSDLALGLICFVVVAWRRRSPVTVAVVVTLASAVSGSVGGPATLALFSLATRRRWREILPVAWLAFFCGLVLGSVEGPQPVDTAAMFLLLGAVVGVTVGWGMYVGSRRELLHTLHERARTAEAEQEARVARARAAERARIAREMHDVLAHRISLVTMHAGALTYRKDLPAAQVEETAELIRGTAHQALVELREVLGVLREDSGDAHPELPQPGADDLTNLVLEAQEVGMNVRLLVKDVALGTIPDSIGRTTYRVVQEGLTNARKHAPSTFVTVTVRGEEGVELVVQVRNLLPVGRSLGVPESGLGIVGLTERTALAGGRLTHGVDGDSFLLEVALPWPT